MVLNILRLLEEGHLIRMSQVLRTLLLSFFTDAVVEMQCVLLEFLVTAQKPHTKMSLSYP